MYWIIAIVLFSSLLGFLVYASADISSGVYLKSYCRGCPGGGKVALTFDDGPDEVMTPKILDILAARGVKAVFFVVGEKVERNPGIVKRIIEEGHLLGNHTHTHSPYFPLYSAKKVRGELKKSYEAVSLATGRKMFYFRPPMGITNPIIAKVVSAEDYKTIGWSVRSFDTISSRSRSRVAERVGKALHDGAVILLHDRLPEADRLLEMILDKIDSRGFALVRADELMGLDAYRD